MGSNQDDSARPPNLGGTGFTLPSWEQVGGTNTMRRAVELFVDRAVADPFINYDRGGMYPQNLDTITRTKAPGACLSEPALGGPLPYNGRSLADIHGPMAINAGELDAFLAHFRDAMRECGLSAAVISQLMVAIAVVRPSFLGSG